MAKVTIIIPVYGVEKYIERCARSLFEQTLDDLEYLFIDDCTPDISIEVLRQVLDDYPERKPQVVVHHMEQNSGQAAVRTWGMQHATGDYIIHCDSDDWVEPNYCEMMYDAAINENADAVICDYVTTDGTKVLKRTKGCHSTDKENLVNAMLLQSDPWSLCNKMFKRTSCYKADLVYPVGNMGEDMVMTFQLILNANKVAYVPQFLYNYFFNPTSITKTPSEEKLLSNFKQFKANADVLFSLLEERDLSDEFKDGILSCKWFLKKYLWNLPASKVMRELWRTTYPSVRKEIFQSNLVSHKDRMKILLTNCGLYPRKHHENK